MASLIGKNGAFTVAKMISCTKLAGGEVLLLIRHVERSTPRTKSRLTLKGSLLGISKGITP